MRTFLTIIVLMLGLAAGSAFSPGLAASSEDKAAFKAAYARFNAAVEAADKEAALTAANEALELGKLVYADDHPNLAGLYLNKGYALLDNGSAEDAIAPLKEAVSRFDEIYGRKGAELVEPVRALADALDRRRIPGADSDDSLVYWQRLWALTKDFYGEESFAFAEANLGLGRVSYSSSGNQRKASGYFRAAVKAYEKVYGEPAYKTGVAVFWLAKSEQLLRRKKKAEALYLEALDIFEKTTEAGSETELMTHAFLVGLYQDRGKDEEATFHCQAISRKRPRTGVDGFTPLYKKPPVYPRGAASGGREGWAIVEFTVGNDGIVSDPFVVKSDGGSSFERAALDAVINFRYAPAVKDGELVATEGVRNKITFRMSRD